ncbi:MAG: hypothetical protein ONB52_22015 [candidate division KSB1 bacterium]|nr:hypothetical protein [candidate division KSB1 bacterium]
MDKNAMDVKTHLPPGPLPRRWIFGGVPAAGEAFFALSRRPHVSAGTSDDDQTVRFQAAGHGIDSFDDIVLCLGMATADQLQRLVVPTLQEVTVKDDV